MKRSVRGIAVALAALAVVLLAACSGGSTATPTSTSNPNPGTSAPTPTATVLQPTETPTPTRTPVGTIDTSGFATPTPSPTPTPTPLAQGFDTGPLANTHIVFSRSGQTYSLMTISPNGRNLTQVATAPNAVLNPRWSPDGKEIAYIAADASNVHGFVIVDTTGNTITTQKDWACISCAPYVVWSPTTPILYVTRDRGIAAHDTSTGALNGGSDAPLVATLPSALSGFSGLDLKGSNDFIVSSMSGGQWDLYSMTGATRITNTTWDELGPRLSPDGTKVAFAANPHGQFDIYVLTLANGQLSQLTNSPADDVDPAWSPDGKFIVFSSNRSSDYNLYITSDAGENIFLAKLTNAPGDDRAPDWK